MAHIKDIRADVRARSSEDFVHLLEWLAEKDTAEKDTAKDEERVERR